MNSTRNEQKESASGLKPAPARGSALDGAGFLACLSLRAATLPMHPTTSLQPAHLKMVLATKTTLRQPLNPSVTKEGEAHLLLKQGPSVSNRAASCTPVLGIGRVSYDGAAERAASRTAAGPRSCPPRSHSCRTPPILPAPSCKSIVSIWMVEEERRYHSPRTRAQLQATLLDPPFRPCSLAAGRPPRGSGSQL